MTNITSSCDLAISRNAFPNFNRVCMAVIISKSRESVGLWHRSSTSITGGTFSIPSGTNLIIPSVYFDYR